MLTIENIILNGDLTTFQDCGTDISGMLSSNYVYQEIHTFDHKALNLSAHLTILNSSLKYIHNIEVDLTEVKLQECICELLRSNKYPKESNKVTIKVFGDYLSGNSRHVTYLIQVTEQLLYTKYKVWHTRPMISVYPCEHPYMGYPTAISHLAAKYGREYALRNGAEESVIQRENGILTNVNDEPLFLVFGNEMFTSPLHTGANNSVMRQLALRAAQAEGIKVTEYALESDMLNSCDEAFTLNTQGIVSIGGYKKARYYNLMANRLIRRLNEFIY